MRHRSLSRNWMSFEIRAIGYPPHSRVKWLDGTLAKGSFRLVVPLQYSEQREPV